MCAVGEPLFGFMGGRLTVTAKNDTQIDPFSSENPAGEVVRAGEAFDVYYSVNVIPHLWVKAPGSGEEISIEVHPIGNRRVMIGAEAPDASGLLRAHFGLADYNDTATSVTPINMVANEWTTITNDGLGPFSRNGLPPSVPTLLGADGSLDLTNLTENSDVLVRPDFTVTPSSNNASLDFRFLLGAPGSQYDLPTSFGRLDLGAGVPYRRSLYGMYVYAGDANTRDNPVYLQARLSTNGTLVNAGMALKLYKV